MSSSTSGPLRLAEEYLVRGDVKEALCIYQRISETEPSNLTIKSRLGELCALANQNSDAVRVLADVARSHIREGHTAEAAGVLRKILKLSPSDPDILMDIAGLLGRSGLSAEAERCYLSAADMYAGLGETAKLENAYEMATATGPTNPELLMKLGAVCHRSGRLVESYRAFMKAAGEYNKRGDDSAALDAYGKALKVAPSGAEAGNAVAEVMRHLGLGDSAGTASRPRTAERAAPPLPFPHAAPVTEPLAIPRGDGVLPPAKAEATDDELLVGKISKAELLFGFGRFDQAIALLKELADMKPNDPRVYRKLKDIYLRSEMPEEAASVYRELARIYKDQGDEEVAGDCLASSRRLSGLPVEPFSEKTPAAAGDQPNVVWQPLGEPKEPDLTLITPALTASPPAARYIPSRHRAEPTDPGTEYSSGMAVPSDETPDSQSNQTPKVVLSTPTTAPVRISTPPLTGNVREPAQEFEDDYTGAGSGMPGPSRPSVDPTEERALRQDDPAAGQTWASELSSVSAPAMPHSSVPARPQPHPAVPSGPQAGVLSGPQTAVPSGRQGAVTAPQDLHSAQPAPYNSATATPPQSTPPPVPDSQRAAVNPSPTIVRPPAPAVSAKATKISARAKVASAPTTASSPSTLFGVQMDTNAEPKLERTGKPRYWIAAVVAVVLLSGSGAGYYLFRRSQARKNVAVQPIETEAAELPAELPPAIAPTVEVNAVTTEAPAESPERQPDVAANQAKKTPDAAAQKQQPQYQAVTTTPTPYQTPVQQTQAVQQPRPTPPPTVGPVGAVSAGGAAPAIAPGALSRDLPAAPPPPTPGPTARRAAVMAGGEVLRRIEPVYPQAARSAHITGTVTVELSINEQGNVISVRATSGPGMLAAAAESAARGFKFKPITLDGVPVKSSRTVLFHFKE